MLSHLGCHCDWVMQEPSGDRLLCLVQELSDGYRMYFVKNVLAALQGHVSTRMKNPQGPYISTSFNWQELKHWLVSYSLVEKLGTEVGSRSLLFQERAKTLGWRVRTFFPRRKGVASLQNCIGRPGIFLYSQHGLIISIWRGYRLSLGQSNTFSKKNSLCPSSHGLKREKK